MGDASDRDCLHYVELCSKLKYLCHLLTYIIPSKANKIHSLKSITASLLALEPLLNLMQSMLYM